MKIKNKSDLVEKLFKEGSDVITYFSYEIADLKTLLLDLGSSVRGIGGCKQGFNVDNLPSVKRCQAEKNKILNQSVENETETQKLERHKAFFENLKNSFKDK
jgi:hypothetical protein